LGSNTTVRPILFSGYSYYRTAACCGYLTSNQKLLIDTKHIKQVNVKLYSFTLTNKATDKQ